jgi:nicotinate-nucleotide adenylyltransferase
VLAQEARDQLSLDRVLFVPTGIAPHKEIAPEPGAELRLEMTRLAVEGDERFAVSAIEVERKGPSYTYETLELLAAEDEKRELVFVMGADAALGLGDWRQPERVIELARLAVAPRRGLMREEIEAAVKSLTGPERIDFVEMPEIGISSSMVRERAGAGAPLRFIVPDPVADLIQSNGIYAG